MTEGRTTTLIRKAIKKASKKPGKIITVEDHLDSKIDLRGFHSIFTRLNEEHNYPDELRVVFDARSGGFQMILMYSPAGNKPKKKKKKRKD